MDDAGGKASRAVAQADLTSGESTSNPPVSPPDPPVTPPAAPGPRNAAANPSNTPPGRDPLRPLADRMRPRSLDEFIGQSQVLGPGKPLRTAIERGQLHSFILWGPPGTGKTTLARLIAQKADAHFIALS